MRPHPVPTVLSLVAVLALAGCNGAAGSGAPGATTGATAGAAATAVPGATEGTAASVAPGASIDLGTSTGGLAHLSSYKVTMHITGQSPADVETTVVNGATPAKMVVETQGSKSFRFVEIGNDVWVDQGSGTYVKNAIPKTTADAMIQAFDPVMFTATLQSQPEFKYLQNQGTEQKNGINSTHFHADQNTPLPAGASPIPAGAVFDMWVAVDGGYLVALEASGMNGAGDATGAIQMEISNVNDPSLTISPPA